MLSDVRYGVRSLLARPGLAAVALATLAIGIGANTSIFTVLNGVLLRPLPYQEPNELVVVWQDHSRIEGPTTEWPSPNNFFDWRDQNEVFEGMFALGGFLPTLAGVGEPEELNGVQVSHDALTLLGIEPSHGRGFRAGDDTAGSELVVILSYGLWQRRFGGDPDVLGTSLALDGESATVVGVMPADFDFPIVRNPEILTPLRIDESNACGRSCYTIRVIARLEDQVSLERARADMNAIAARLERDYPGDNTGVGIRLVPLHEQIVGPLRAEIWLLAGSVGLVLLIACANVANLMLARALDREREVATRIAMGASRSRLVRQLLTESLLLAGVGAALGVVLALWGVDVVVSLIPEELPRSGELAVDSTALIFTTLLAVVTGLAFGLVPAARASNPSLHRSLKEGARGTGGGERFRAALVIAEVALALSLLIGAGLLIRSLDALVRVDPGFDPKGVLTAGLKLVGTRYDQNEARTAFVDRLLRRVRALPGVEEAGVIHVLPMGGVDADTGFLIEGRAPPRPGRTPVAWYRPASPDYFETMKTRLVRGRWLRRSDDAAATPVVIVNEAAVRRYWSDEDPLRSRVRVTGAWRQVVGVAADTRHFGLDQAPRPAMYFPYGQLPLRFLSLVVRTREQPSALVEPVRNVVREIDPELAVSRIASMEEVIRQTIATPRIVTILLGVFAASALTLAAIGLYGIMNYLVGRQTREIGIRMALGASAGDVLRWAVGRGTVLIAIGVVLGLAVAFVLSRYLESLLFGITSADLPSFVLGVVVLAVAAVLACYLPARRAAGIDPVVALRHE